MRIFSKLEQNSQQKTVVLTLQKFEESLALKLFAIAALTSLGVFGRAAFQTIPSVEPLTPLVTLVGFVFGPVAGFVSGASGFYASNFLVWGGQGPWTILQSLGAGLAGIAGGFLGFGKKSRWKFLIATGIGIVAYELVVTLGSAGMVSLVPGFIALYILTSVPFSAVHLVSSLGFSAMFYEFGDRIEKFKGRRLVEQEVLSLRGDTGSGSELRDLKHFIYSRKIFGKSDSKHSSGFRIEQHLEDDSRE